ncbi:MAG TPA: hypothetical protein VGH28_19205 [Polyangiaceae bacterium]|jgi:photosystem II stability/assembly factor-like uncharacterized protein
MKLFAALALCAVACSDTSTVVPDAGQDAADQDTFVDPNTAYEHAVLNAEWQKLGTGPSAPAGAKQDDVFFLDANLGWAANGPTSSIHKTTDGGATWNKVYTHAGTYFRALLFLDASHGFAGNIGAGLSGQITDTNVMYETTDGGTTWNPVTNITGPAPGGVCNFTAVDATHIFAVGRANTPSFVLSSSDAGATWTSIDVTSKMMMLVDARFTSPTDGILVGMNNSAVATVMATTDGAQTLTEVFTSKTMNSLVWKLSFPTNDVGYAAIQDATTGPPSFAKTTDGGKTWTEMPLPQQANAKSPYPAIGIGFVTPNVGWVSPEDPALPTYVTTDGGNTWNVDPALKSPINRFRFVDQNTAYAIGGAVWKLSVAWP